MRRFILWEGLDDHRMEAVELSPTPDGWTARGTQLGASDLEAYRLDYELDLDPGFVTRRLEVRVATAADQRHAILRHDGGGGWSWDAHGAPAAEPGLLASLADARDCDLGFSPLTNTLPVRRLRLAETGAAAADIVTAWVLVPDLRLHAYPQRYEPLGPARVRFVDRGLCAGFTAELELDPDGFVVLYPELARRV